MQNNPIKSIIYNEARLDFFRRQKDISEGKLSWWKTRLDSPNYPAFYVEDRCAELGAEISYYTDVISMLERRATLDELSSRLEDDGK